MNIKILTYYYSNNYGALLQAYCLRNFFQKFISNNNVEFVRYCPSKLIYYEIYKPLITFDIFKFILFLIKNFKIYVWRLRNKFSIPLTNYFYNKEKSFFVYGSDEIWNFNNNYFGFDEIYFGGLNDNFKIAYSVSIGRASATNISKKKEKQIKKLLKQFNDISVRDIGTFNFVNKLSKNKPEITIDPTLLEDKNLPNYNNKKIKIKKFALIYGDFFSQDNINLISIYCKKNKLNMISVGYFNKWVDKNYITADPSEFLYYVKFSDIIFTSMFHGVLLSVKFRKQFWFSLDPKRENKLSYFIKYLNIKNRQLKNYTLLNKKLNYNLINKKIRIWQLKSQNYLLLNLNKFFRIQKN